MIGTIIGTFSGTGFLLSILPQIKALKVAKFIGTNGTIGTDIGTVKLLFLKCLYQMFQLFQ